MTPLQSTPRVSVVIPLYHSAPFFDSIAANIAAALRRDTEIIVSDRHGGDDTIERLTTLFRADPRVRFLKHRDGLDWVGHINTLLVAARGEYWRLLPHDDLSPPGSLEALVSALDAHPEAVLAYGPTRAIDGAGHRLPERDRPFPHPERAAYCWDLGLALEMFWLGHFDGAFKGLIRRDRILRERLLIRGTVGQVLPERCWLFALCLLGPFRFVPEALYVKRFYPGSAHTRWEITGRNYYSAAQAMSHYLWKLLDPLPARWYGLQDIWLNARRRAVGRPQYLAAPGLLPPLLGTARLPTLAAFSSSRRSRIEALRRLPLPARKRRASVSP